MLVVDVVNVFEGEVVVCVVCVNVGDDGGRTRGVEDWESRYLYASSADGRVSHGRPAKSVAPPVVLSSKIRVHQVGSKDYVGGIHLHGQPGMAPPACSDPCALVSSSLLRLLTAKATLVTSNSL
jgi:hypothetical protein